MAAADGESDGEKSAFRWIDAARCAVASVVTVLIVAVIVNAVKVVLRPESLSFLVGRGTVFMRRIQSPRMLFFDLNIRAHNPSGRARIYHLNFTAYLFDSNASPSSSTPDRDSLIYFPLNDGALQQQRTVDSWAEVNGTRRKSMDAPLFDKLYDNKGETISDVTMRLDGVLVTEIRSGFNSTPHGTTYYCRPLIVGGDQDDEAFQNMPDVLCREVPHGNF